jgi:hypothetical protein
MIKLLKKNGIFAVNPQSGDLKFYREGDEVIIKDNSRDLFVKDLFHFYDRSGYVFELKETDYILLS